MSYYNIFISIAEFGAPLAFGSPGECLACLNLDSALQGQRARRAPSEVRPAGGEVLTYCDLGEECDRQREQH